MNNFNETYRQMFSGIELCIKQKLQFPTLTLIYSTIDTLAYIAYGDGYKEIGKNFKKWINEYMYQEKQLNVTPMDLYSARNAIVHTLTPHSRDTKNKKASVIIYAWGNANFATGEKSIEMSNCEYLKVIHINDLYESLYLGFLKFINSDLDKEVKERMNEHYTNVSQEMLENYVNLKQHP